MLKQYRAEATAIAADEEYELQYSGKVNDIIPVCKYRSRKTGLRILVAQVQGPLVNGYLCLGTRLMGRVLLPRDASAERGNATVSRPSVCLSVCP